MCTSPTQRLHTLEKAHAAIDKALADLRPVAEFDILADVADIVYKLEELLGRHEEGTGFDAIITYEKNAIKDGRAARMFTLAKDRRVRLRRLAEAKARLRMSVPA